MIRLGYIRFDIKVLFVNASLNTRASPTSTALHEDGKQFVHAKCDTIVYLQLMKHTSRQDSDKCK